MEKITMNITIPGSVDFSDLKLARDADGMVSFDWAPINAICEASNLDADIFHAGPEDYVSGLIVTWYQRHIADGGERDPVADDLIAEVMAENELGGGISHPPGRA